MTSCTILWMGGRLVLLFCECRGFIDQFSIPWCEWEAYFLACLTILWVGDTLISFLCNYWKANWSVDCPGCGRLIDMLIVLGVESLLRRYTSVFVRERHIDYDWFLLDLYVLSLERISWCLYVFVYFTCSGYIYPMILF